jgi:hypothetical protein
MRNLFLLFLLAIPFLGCDQQDTAPNLDGKYQYFGSKTTLNRELVAFGYGGGFGSYTLELKQGNFILDYHSDLVEESGVASGTYTLTKLSIYNQYRISFRVDKSTTSAYSIGKFFEYTDVALLSDSFSTSFGEDYTFRGPGLTYSELQKDTYDYNKNNIAEEFFVIQNFFTRIN